MSAATAGEALAAVALACPGLAGLRRPDGQLAPQYLLSLDGERFVTDMAQPLRPRHLQPLHMRGVGLRVSPDRSGCSS